jgi:hypothetical protein
MASITPNSTIQQRRQRISNQSDERTNRSSRITTVWEVTTSSQPSTGDHIALDMDGVDHEVIDFEEYDRRLNHLSLQQYQNVGGQLVMTEEKLRRFTEQQRQYCRHTAIAQQNIGSSSTNGSVASISPSGSNYSVIGEIPPWKRKLEEEKFYRIQDYHTVFRIPHYVSDANYHKYLIQRGYQSESSINDEPASLLSKTCCAATCSVFSAIAVVFLLFIGFLLDTQPLYIPGALPALTVQSTVQYNSQDGTVKSYNKPRVQFLIPGPPDERLSIASTAYHAAGLYFVSMMISLYVYNPLSFHQVISRVWSYARAFRRRQYTDIPDSDFSSHNMISSTTIATSEGLILGDVDPRGHLRRFSSSYQLGMWKRFTNTLKRWLASKGWYQPQNRKIRKYEPKKTG